MERFQLVLSIDKTIKRYKSFTLKSWNTLWYCAKMRMAGLETDKTFNYRVSLYETSVGEHICGHDVLKKGQLDESDVM